MSRGFEISLKILILANEPHLVIATSYVHFGSSAIGLFAEASLCPVSASDQGCLTVGVHSIFGLAELLRSFLRLSTLSALLDLVDSSKRTFSSKCAARLEIERPSSVLHSAS